MSNKSKWVEANDWYDALDIKGKLIANCTASDDETDYSSMSLQELLDEMHLSEGEAEKKCDDMWKKSIRSSTYAYMRLSGHSPQESDKVALETDKEERKEFFIS